MERNIKMSKENKNEINLPGVGGNERGLNMQLYSGKPFYPLDPRAEEININDLAHSLSLQCRFNGHCLTFYSVAEHSVFVSKLVPLEYARIGLLHDGEEYISSDLIRPFKYQMKEEWDAKVIPIKKAVDTYFGLPSVLPQCVLDVDNVALATEKKHLMAKPIGVNWGHLPEPVEPGYEMGLDWREAKVLFLERYNALHELYVKGKIL